MSLIPPLEDGFMGKEERPVRPRGGGRGGGTGLTHTGSRKGAVKRGSYKARALKCGWDSAPGDM